MQQPQPSRQPQSQSQPQHHQEQQQSDQQNTVSSRLLASLEAYTDPQASLTREAETIDLDNTSRNVFETIAEFERLKGVAVRDEDFTEAERLKQEVAKLRRTSLSTFRTIHRQAKAEAEDNPIDKMGCQLDDAPTSYDESSAAAWLLQAGFDPSQLRQAIRIGAKLKTPMIQAVQLGNLAMARWLYENGAADDAISTNEEGNTLLLIASYVGHLYIAKWLHDEAGAAEHVTKPNFTGSTPMHFACLGGNLSICQWLHEVGAAQDISKSDANGVTPMLVASQKGHLRICQWLFSVGAVNDIDRANYAGITPLRISCSRFWWPEVWKFLILKGALNKGEDHVSREIVVRDTPRLKPWSALGKETNNRRRDMLMWAKSVEATHSSFMWFLMGTLPSRQIQAAALHIRGIRALADEGCIPISAHGHLLQLSNLLLRARMEAGSTGHRSPGVSPLVWRLKVLDEITSIHILEIIADFCGVKRGRELRIVREFAVHLSVVIAREIVTP